MNSVGTSDFLSGLKAVRLPGLLVGAVLAVLVSWLPTVSAEETGKTFKLAFLNPAPPVPRFSELHVKTLRDLGYVEGRNLFFMERWAGGSEERLHRAAAELVDYGREVDRWILE